MIEPMFAYIDPGTGSIVLQILIGGILGASYFLRRNVARAFGWFGFGKRTESSDNSTTN